MDGQHRIATSVPLILIAAAAFAIPLPAGRLRLPAIPALLVVMLVAVGAVISPVGSRMLAPPSPATTGEAPE